ncbi:uncharacterized protein DSM5745_03449 [Aspergillus mulundensis]|uniref:Uncharacterized protein n=1 Tax=Aspergillus mulundensis TaxID=1810919 RepID=A0A3D8SKF6_9EURO|nr:hypothetical protein DSM5745_03449 [Aspergillus mulundensis]RDW86807.1 hypothetical protein DSM5745_03449 [Aspergillus mulundensis]
MSSLAFGEQYHITLQKRLVSGFDERLLGNVHGVDDTRDPTQDRQTDVDEEVSTASALKKDSKRRQDEGKDELANVTKSGIRQQSWSGLDLAGPKEPRKPAAVGYKGDQD